jgi:chromosome partitioning protein
MIRARPPKATVVAVANQKGGVAKTTTVASLGAAWAQLGQRVLIVDLDPQACLTFSVGYDPESIGCSVGLYVARASGDEFRREMP